MEVDGTRQSASGLEWKLHPVRAHGIGPKLQNGAQKTCQRSRSCRLHLRALLSVHSLLGKWRGNRTRFAPRCAAPDTARALGSLLRGDPNRARSPLRAPPPPHPPCLSHAQQLVLINISDHHTRTRANTPGATAPGVPAPAVMGCLLGSQSGRSVDIRNSFEVRYAAGPDGTLDIDITYLLKKQEQCEPGVAVLGSLIWALGLAGWFAAVAGRAVGFYGICVRLHVYGVLG